MNFLSFGAFWFAAALPVVILFYLLKRKRVVRLVSSTVLWQRFLAESQASAPFQKLRKNWLLLLQLLLLILAILALARPFFAGRVLGGRLQVVILDASASMQSTDESPSRFEKARASALSLVDSLRDTDQMVVLQAAASAEVLQSATSEKAALRRALQNSIVTDGPTRLTDALKMAESLTRDNNEAEVHLFSDGAATGLSELQNKGLHLVFHNVGKSANNLGIVSLDLRPNPEDATQRAVFTAIANPSSQPRATELELRFDDQLVESRTLTVPPTNTVPVVFLVGQGRDGVFSVHLTAPDELEADNTASVLSRLPKPVKVLLVSRGNRFLERALRAAGPIELTVVPSVPSSPGTAEVIVLDGIPAPDWPAANTLAFQVMNTNWFAPVGSIEAPTIVDWKSSHPLLRFVNLDNVLIARTTAVQPPPWAVRVIDATQTPLVLAGEIGRQRAVWVGFDVLDSTWPLRVSFPIFIANAIDWLNPAAIRAAQQLVRAGEPFRLPLDQPVTQAELTLPGGTRRTLAIDPRIGEVVFGDTTRQGVYQVNVGTNSTPFVVNLLDGAETDITPRTELDLGRFGSVAATTTRRANLELWRWITALALGVLLFEWWFYHRRSA